MVNELHKYFRRRAAIHEAGHIVIAEHFKTEIGHAFIEQDSDGFWFGEVQYYTEKKFQSAVQGWGGNIAEFMFIDHRPEEEPDIFLFSDYDLEENYLEDFSPGDWHSIHRTVYHRRAFKTAWKIIFKRSKRLLEIANQLELEGGFYSRHTRQPG